ncbi:UDP-N-acetylglucosamine 2-epimerase (non-hydrolyzing) [Helicobacter monodelphidis]|uniref:non-hydrolyzing UDP-N-acetylglucosamine 2-epimerase n=1 Tax=Helicobacter sp. 15-1451 TaxID=2004995 RepID=UPI000DCEF926|nr:UDP-N-acetylglucosamine 2-epimerase (non-hydrolyzing) [Helicobacter sp. 15-1451]RAX58965.1 UDP-N-acetylglucosamine 2-epimerase (non-hydrolyzing) [Helicobacter sp. 15-1451]
MLKIVTIIGARPQFIKAGTVSREFQKYPNMCEIIVHTGQHYDVCMSDIFFEELHIPKPNHFLQIGGLGYGAMLGRMIESIEKVLLAESPQCVLVYGDTDSTLAGALAASKLHIPIIHIEAGLRSFNMKMPEEINRILTDRVSTLLFCPTQKAIENLYNEGFNNFDAKIFKSGDVMQDGALYYRQFARQPNIKLQDSFVLCTLHRAENTDSQERLSTIFLALEEIAKNKQVVLPLHPRTKKRLEQYAITPQYITFVEPLGYLEMIWLLEKCEYVMSDSGGLQKEAYFFEKPCLVLRDETEWEELVSLGYNLLVGANRQKILKAITRIDDLRGNDFTCNLYGQGRAATEIVGHILEVF